jgi:tRNA modification GTPase
VVEVSALTGAGVVGLEGAIEEVVFAGRVVTAEPALVGSARHRDLLRRAQAGVEAAIEARANGLPLDFTSIGLREAVHVLGEITGESVSDMLLETIFSRFCIGK